MDTTTENFSDSDDTFKILKMLIDTGQAQHIPYYSYFGTTVSRYNLDDTNRMLYISLDKIRITLPRTIIETFKWLYTNLWRNFIIHGDLTDTNIIYQNENLYLIDWKDRATILTPDVCSLWYIFVDMIDFLNVFFVKFPRLPFFSNIDRSQFDMWHSLIKGQELLMEDSTDVAINKSQQCKKAIMDNLESLVSFLKFVNQIFEVDLLTLVIHISQTGGKRKKETRKS